MKVGLGIRAPRYVSVLCTEVAEALGMILPARTSAEDRCRLLVREIAELAERLKQHSEPLSELRTLLAAKRIELAALRQGHKL